MYDIFFDLNNMHQTVEETDGEQLSLLYDELTAISTKQSIRAGSDEAFSFDFELDLDNDDRAVIVKKPLVCEKCNEIYPYAEPNGENNSFRCYSCRKYG